MTWSSIHGVPTQRPQACWHAWTFRQHASWKHVNPFHSLAACSRGSSALCVLKQGLKKLQRKCWGGLVSVAKARKSWGLAGILLRTGHKLFTRHHSGKIEPVTVDIFPWCVHASNTVGPHPSFTFELEKLRNSFPPATKKLHISEKKIKTIGS